MFKKAKFLFQDKNKLFQNYFFPAVIMEWNKIDVNICNSAFCNACKKVILKSLDLNPIKCLMLTVVKG